MPKRTPLLNRNSELGYWEQREFNYVRCHFFPRWDSKRQWRIGTFDDCPLLQRIEIKNDVHEVTHLIEFRSVDGGCFDMMITDITGFPNARTIFDSKVILFSNELTEGFWGDPYFRYLCVHEICHAIQGSRIDYSTAIYKHDDCWRKRMSKAAKRARKLRQPLLAWFIETGIKHSRTTPGSQKWCCLCEQVEERISFGESDYQEF